MFSIEDWLASTSHIVLGTGRNYLWKIWNILAERQIKYNCTITL